jgi:hypothetical protein
VYGCLFARGVPVELHVGASEGGVFGGPALSLVGHLVGLASEGCEQDSCWTIVSLVDLRDKDSAYSGGLTVDESAAHTAKVGSLRFTRTGTVAFITCPEDGDFFGERQPNCIRPGSKNRVWIGNVHSKAKTVIDRGRGIDPSSLRLKGLRVTWVKNGRRKSHPLP